MKSFSEYILLFCIAISTISCLEANSITADKGLRQKTAAKVAPKAKRQIFNSDDHGPKVNILNRRLLNESAEKPADTPDSDSTAKPAESSTDSNNNVLNEVDEDDAKSKQPPFCNHELLYSFGVLNAGLREEPSKLCGDISKNTCCSPTSEQIILNFWKNNNRAKIKMYIEGYMWIFKAVINFYDDFMEKAKKIHSFPSAPPECKTAADKMIENFLRTDDITSFVPKLEKAYQHIGFARKSFYCVLCSTDAQPYFDTINKNIIFAKKFCEDLVESTITEFYTRSITYMKIFNYMNVIADCDPNIPYMPDVYTIDLQMDNASSTIIGKCYQSFLKDSDRRVFFEDCEDYCSRFSLTHAREMFEGNFGKIYFLYQKIMALGKLPQKVMYDEIDFSIKYDFSFISPEFYESNLKSFELDAYSSSFGRNGIELFYVAANSDLSYGSKSVGTGFAVGFAILVLARQLF